MEKKSDKKCVPEWKNMSDKKCVSQNGKNNVRQEVCVPEWEKQCQTRSVCPRMEKKPDKKCVPEWKKKSDKKCLSQNGKKVRQEVSVS